MLVVLTRAEALHIAVTLNERRLADVPGVHIDVPGFRLRFVRAALDAGDREWDFSGEELRALDMLLTDADPRGVKLEDGTPVMALVEKLWRARVKSDIVPVLKGATDGRDANDDDDAHEDDRAAALRS